MPLLTTAPKLVAVEAVADEASPGKVTLRLTYRAWYNQTIIEVVAVKDQVAEADGLDPDFWIDIEAEEMTNAFDAAGYQLSS